MTTQEVLPSIVPLMNLIVSVIAALGMGYILLRRLLKDRSVSRLLILDAIAFSAIIVLVAGAAFQFGILSSEIWIPVGTGGRIVVVAGVMALLLQRWEHIPVLDPVTDSREQILARAREEAAKLLKEAAAAAAEKVRLDAMENASLRKDVRRTADNTERIADEISASNGHSDQNSA